ncbi:MAG: hypothetical protein NVSMB42_14200 [Herpetosiphon sp.]
MYIPCCIKTTKRMESVASYATQKRQSWPFDSQAGEAMHEQGEHATMMSKRRIESSWPEEGGKAGRAKGRADSFQLASQDTTRLCEESHHENGEG